MTAYELADFLEEMLGAYDCVQWSSEMLRMQADEIKALREQLNELQ